MHRRRAYAVGVASFLFAFALVSCEDDEPTTPQDSATPTRLCSPTAPESLLCSMEALYNDTLRTVTDRLSLYADLFSKDFIFHLQPGDIQNGLPPSWGTDAEIEALRAIFTAQDNGEIYSLRLSLVYDSAQDVDPPQQDREGWKEIFVTNLYLRLMFNPEDGLEVNAHQAEVHFQPPTEGRWTIGEWWDLPRPEPRLTVETATFGNIKANYLP